MKLQDVPNNTWVETERGSKFFFDHVEDFYAVCREIGGGISRYPINKEVKISEDQPGNPK